jgi:hypothetical protein
MYSPKIVESFIPYLYRESKRRGLKMTVLVNRFLAKEVNKIKRQEKKGGDLYEQDTRNA